MKVYTESGNCYTINNKGIWTVVEPRDRDKLGEATGIITAKPKINEPMVLLWWSEERQRVQERLTTSVVGIVFD